MKTAKILISLSLLIGAFFAHEASAASLYERFIPPTTGSHRPCEYNIAGTPFDGLICDFSGFTVPGGGISDINTADMYISCDDGAPSYQTNSYVFFLYNNDTSMVVATSTPEAVSCEDGEYNVNVINPTNFVLHDTANLDAGDEIYYGVYKDSLNTTINIAGDPADTGNYSLELYDDVPLDSQIELYFPSVSVASSSLPDFSKWRVLRTNIFDGYIVINYALSTSTLGTVNAYQDTLQVAPGVTLPSAFLDVPKTRPLWFPPLTVPVTWYAQPSWTSYDGLESAEGVIVEFSINPATPPSSVPGIFGENPNEWFSPPQLVTNPLANGSSTPVDSSGFSGFNLFNSSSSVSGAAFACYMKSALFDLGNFLFRPSAFSTGVLSNARDSFTTVFPFSVFYSLRGYVSDTASSTISAASSTLTWNYSLGGQTITIAAGSSTLPTYLGSTVSNIYFSICRFLLWLMLAMVIWKTIVHDLIKPK